jgi:hypothetical protein|tara:strand:+ start:690 stop:905 length:216 start_codon:yes stop_codon:yes gene_type:complete
MSTEIKILGAVFKCQADEDIFYQRLSEIKGIKKIVTHNSCQSVTVDDTQKKQTISDIGKVCDIWHATMNSH